jgi:TIR domain/Effector-associated domain 11
MEQQIRQLITKGKTKDALDLMTPYANEAILLRARLSSIERNNTMGLIDFNDFQREMNRINFSVLSLLDSDDIDLPEQDRQISASSNNNYAPNQTSSNKVFNARKPRVFVSYAHEDSELLRQMESQLNVLKKNGVIDIWTDKEILPGQDWNKDINESLVNADIILLLLSSSFLNSDYIWRNEMQIALKNSKEGKAVAIPVILRPCLWKEVEGLAQLQALPINEDGRLVPISKWGDRDEAWVEVAKGLKKVIENMKQKSR